MNILKDRVIRHLQELGDKGRHIEYIASIMQGKEELNKGDIITVNHYSENIDDNVLKEIFELYDFELVEVIRNTGETHIKELRIKKMKD